jgi:hypothetical protein
VPPATYDAFISYSHAADGRLAPALQRAFHRFARPVFKVRALRVFRDKESLSANPALWGAIERALGQSAHFVLLASPDAARSQWVNREMQWWMENRSVSKLLIVLTAGEIVWDADKGDFDWDRTDALPGAVRGRVADEPLWVDLRWAKTVDDLSLRTIATWHPRSGTGSWVQNFPTAARAPGCPDADATPRGRYGLVGGVRPRAGAFPSDSTSRRAR